MNAQIKADWIAALRVYPQARKKLREGNAFCIGGVLCDLHSQAHGIPWDEGRYLGWSTFMPKRVLGWAGLTPAEFAPLQAANDKGFSFLTLAYFIAHTF